MDQIFVLLARVIDEREHAPAAPIGVTFSARGELLQNFVGGSAVLGDHRCASSDRVKMLFVPEPRMFDGGIVIESVMVGTSYQ